MHLYSTFIFDWKFDWTLNCRMKRIFSCNFESIVLSLSSFCDAVENLIYISLSIFSLLSFYKCHFSSNSLRILIADSFFWIKVFWVSWILGRCLYSCLFQAWEVFSYYFFKESLYPLSLSIPSGTSTMLILVLLIVSYMSLRLYSPFFSFFLSVSQTQ